MREQSVRRGYSHCAPSSTETGLASSAHWIVQTESPLQLSEHESMHCTLQVDPPVQSTLELASTTRSHVEPPLQATEHDVPQEPVHSLSSLQSSEQLFSLHPESPMSQASPGGHAQLVPLQVGGGGPSLPHAPRKNTRIN